MIGGIFIAFILELVVYPVIYALWKWHFEVKNILGCRCLGRSQPRDELTVGHDPPTAPAFFELAISAILLPLLFHRLPG